MATVIESLKSVNAYPILLRTLVEIGGGRGLTLTATVTEEILQSQAYNLAKADLLLWLALAPDISQGGQNYSFTDEQRIQMRSRAEMLYCAYGDASSQNIPKPIYGHKGSRL